MNSPVLTPRLVVRDADAAIRFYIEALEAEELVRFEDSNGVIVQAELKVGDSIFALTEEDQTHNFSPQHFDGSTTILMLLVADVDAIATQMVKAGAEVLIPLDNRNYGRRDGRFRDPFGHLWILAQNIEDVDCDELTRRIAET